MGRFVERYQKHPERGAEHYINQASAYAASLSLGREFGESAKQYFARSPEQAEALEECREDIENLQKVRS